MKSGSTGVFINLKNYIIGIEGQIPKRVIIFRLNYIMLFYSTSTNVF